MDRQGTEPRLSRDPLQRATDTEAAPIRSLERAAHTEPPLIRSLERATHQVGGYLQASLADLELTQAEIHVLSFMQANGASTIAALHESFGHRRSTLTSILDRLERRGLVTRTINRDDRRSFVIEFTPDGERAAARIAEVVGDLERRAAAAMGSGSLALFVEALRVLEATATPSEDS